PTLSDASPLEVSAITCEPTLAGTLYQSTSLAVVSSPHSAAASLLACVNASFGSLSLVPLHALGVLPAPLAPAFEPAAPLAPAAPAFDPGAPPFAAPPAPAPPLALPAAPPAPLAPAEPLAPAAPLAEPPCDAI